MLDDKTRSAINAVRDEAAAQGIVATFALHREKSHLMRLGNSSVSLSTSEELTRLDILATHGRAQASHTALGMIEGPDTVRHALGMAVAKARAAAPKDYQPIPDTVTAPVEESPQYDQALAELEPAAKAEGYRSVISALAGAYNFSGAWSSGVAERYVVTTANRNEAWHLGTDQLFTCVLKHPEKRWELRAVETGWRVGDVRIQRAVEQLAELLPVYERQAGFRVEPGAYTVLLGAEALAEVIGLALWSGLGGRGWEEKMGWTAKSQIGDPILGSNVTVFDDPANEQTFMHGFDDSGQRRSLYELIRGGALAGLMYDPQSAAKYGRQPTGHNLESLSIVMEAGHGPEDPLEAVADRSGVLYIPALHYTHIPNRSQGVFTGSSRFSAVLVDGGQVVAPIFSSRITDSFANVLGNVRALARHNVSVNGSSTYGRRAPVASSVPAYAVIEGVRITDSAEAF
jgi:predicted Zn-dependent protease